jgi:chemotaxis protein MotA
MILLIGFLIVIGSTIGGFIQAGGNPMALLHLSEFIVIGGIALGVLVIASPMALLKSLVGKIKTAFKKEAVPKSEFNDLLKLLYELFSKARRGGLIAIEDDVLSPKESQIFTKYPTFLNNHERVEFLCNGLKPIIDGRLKPEQLAIMLQGDYDLKEEEGTHPVHVLNLVGDSLPGIGIVAAVLGIINTMSAISAGPEKVGIKVAAALTGTFLGVFFAYGFVNPLAARIKLNNSIEMQYYAVIMKGVVGFTGGMAPIMACEAARRAIDPHSQPSSDELEEMVKNTGSSGDK